MHIIYIFLEYGRTEVSGAQKEADMPVAERYMKLVDSIPYFFFVLIFAIFNEIV